MIKFTGNELEELQYCIINTHNKNHPLNLKIQKYTLNKMNNEQLLNLIKIWNNEAIRSQHELKKENYLFEFPQWNKGYLACLEDLKNIINENT